MLQFRYLFRQTTVLEQNGRNHSMSSSASDDLTSAYAGSDDICMHARFGRLSFTSRVMSGPDTNRDTIKETQTQDDG